MTVRQYLVGALLSLAVAACGGGSKKPAQEPVVENKQSPIVAEAQPPALTRNERMLAKLEELEHAMCACTHADCAKRVSDDMTAWSQAESAANKDKGWPKMSEAEIKRATEVANYFGECMMKAMGAGQP